jgi:hypothetical protein
VALSHAHVTVILNAVPCFNRPNAQLHTRWLLSTKYGKNSYYMTLVG